jgi:hypothetical protein
MILIIKSAKAFTSCLHGSISKYGIPVMPIITGQICPESTSEGTVHSMGYAEDIYQPAREIHCPQGDSEISRLS